MNVFSKTTANVAAWNLEGFHGIPPERIEKQIEGLALLDAELVALVEINPITALNDITDGLAKKGVIYNSTIIPQNSKLHIGVLHKEGVTIENPRFIDGSDLGDSAKRKAFVVDVTIGKFDFMLIVVHLKAGRLLRHQKTRDKQAKIIHKYILDNRAGGREDVIVTGDFNMIPGQDISNFHHLGGDDALDFVSSWDLQERFSHILDKGRANLLDGFAVSRTFSGEYIRGSLRLFPMHWTMDMGRESYKNEVSDHLPFVASFRIDKSSGG